MIYSWSKLEPRISDTISFGRIVNKDNDYDCLKKKKKKKERGSLSLTNSDD